MNEEKNNRYLLTVNEVYDIDLVADPIEGFDVVENNQGEFHILSGQKAHKAKLITADFENKQVTFSVSGNFYQVSIADQFDLLVEKMGLSSYAVHKVKDIKAPMPGLVLDVAVKIGQEVIKGDKLLILEAMKMENVIKSEGEGIVKKVYVEKGTAVDKGQLMIEMED